MEGYTAAPIKLHPTRQFYRHVLVLFDALGEEFKEDLTEALQALAQSSSDEPFKAHGHTGHSFSFPINNEFLLVFRRETDRDGQGRALLVHFYLKTIERLE